MSERPIIFSGPMVRAILEGRKTQTRRVVKQAHDNVARNSAWGVFPAKESGFIAWFGIPDTENGAQFTKKVYDHGFPCPYGVPGDTLWVRECFGWSAKLPISNLYDDCTRHACPDLFAYRVDDSDGNWCWRPSIHMPRWASRIDLKVTGVRVERVRSITEEDALAEGVAGELDFTPQMKYAELWNSINAKRGYSWESNPWVWVVEFERQAGGAQ